MVVTAQKPRRFADLAGFRFWAAPKACRNHTPQPPRLEHGQTADFVIVKQYGTNSKIYDNNSLM